MLSRKQKTMQLSDIPKLKHTDSNNFFLLAGPCAIEGEDMAMRIAEKVISITDKLQIPYVFKGSFRKANRSRVDSFTGIGDEKALEILAKVSEKFDVPTVTDIHAAKTEKVVNLKKGQFMSPEAMQHAVKKVHDTGNNKAWVTDRGTMFGYQDMIVDFRGIPTMRQFAPTVLDVTHSLQQPNQSSGVTGGRPDMIETIARAGVVNNVDGLFIETHFDPANAKSDGANMLDIAHLEKLLSNLVAIRKTVRSL